VVVDQPGGLHERVSRSPIRSARLRTMPASPINRWTSSSSYRDDLLGVEYIESVPVAGSLLEGRRP
jgi:hypothetical protein